MSFVGQVDWNTEPVRFFFLWTFCLFFARPHWFGVKKVTRAHGLKENCTQIISSDLIDFFFIESDSEGPRRKKMSCAGIYDLTGATSQSCKVTREMQNIHYQPKSFRT